MYACTTVPLEPHQSFSMQSMQSPTPFRRRFVLPTWVTLLLEVVAVVLPLWGLFGFGSLPDGTLVRTVLPVGLGAWLVWLFAISAWLLPVRSVISARAHSKRLDKEQVSKAYRNTISAPLRGLLVRTILWTVSGAATGLFLHLYFAWPLSKAAELAAIAGLHAYVVACLRAVWWAAILRSVRKSLFMSASPLRRFDATHFYDFALVVTAGIAAAQAAFTFYFVPITRSQYLQFETFVPIALLASLLIWLAVARYLTRDLRQYLALSRGDVPAASASPAAEIFRKSQRLPYQLAILHWVVGAMAAAAAAVVCNGLLGIDLDSSVVLALLLFALYFAAAIYAALWHRDALLPLLSHLTMRYRVPVRSMAPSLSLRQKLLFSFGGIVLLSCSLALIWGFVQFKNQSTEAIARQASVGLSWVKSELSAEAAAQSIAPNSALVRATLRKIAATSPESSATLYYIDDHVAQHEVLAVGGGPMGTPTLPWYVRARIEQGDSSLLQLPKAELTGRAARLSLQWRGAAYDVGAVAVFYPSYLGRGQSMVRPLKELLVFFFVLFAACAGIVAVTVSQFVAPIKRLEQRADAMARGELADPVIAGGEGDEIGRLTFALEEMRRALRDKLRSTEEVNVDLERAVQTRTSDLAKKNRELADALTKLTQAQAQLVRSEKLASIGQLVAGIAHEINNPVNAIVNTVGPLEETIGDVESEDPEVRRNAVVDMRDMVRVVQSGAQRTKAIVSALHNYSRTDDETVVDFDVDRSLSDSLELLRHLLRNNITVIKDYGAVGKVRGHAGQVGQVFMNLLTNAAQAVSGSEDATITITTRGDDNAVTIEMRDNGPGIPAHILPRIWDPFFTTKDVGEGTGLGLSIVHELVERHGGTISVDTKLGKGTVFSIVLPRNSQSA
jgi:signal transduction histidine kinase